jgi:hypothetical protein
MSEGLNDLFEGIQIMSPQELSDSIRQEAKGDGEAPIVEDEGFTITPVKAETGLDEPNTKEITTPTTVGEEKEDKKPTSNESVDEVKYKALIKELVKADILTVEQLEELEDMPGTFDSIKSLMEKTLDSKFKTKEESWKKGLSPDKKRFLEIEDAFDDTTVAIQMAQRLTYLEGLDEESIKTNTELQKQLYYNQLIGKGFSNEDAMEALADAEAVNKLEDKALKALPDLKTSASQIVEKSRVDREEKTKAQIADEEARFKNLIDDIEKRESFIDGLQLNKVAKDKIKNNILNIVHKENGREYNSLMYKQMKNPTEFEMLINYYDSIGMFNVGKDGKFTPDISKIKTVAKTAAVNELDKIISAEDQRGIGRNTSVETSERTGNILDMLERATKKK